MSTYRYRALDSEGHLIAGAMHSFDVGELESQLRRRGLELISARRMLLSGRHAALGRRELATLFFSLEQTVRSGIPLLDGLRDLSCQGASRALRDASAALVVAVEEGRPLSRAMAAQDSNFDAVMVSLVRAGEDSGKLSEAFSRLVRDLKWRDESAARLRKAALYPLVVACAALATILFLLAYLVPQLVPFFEALGTAPPLHTRILFLLSDYLLEWWPWLVALPTASVLGVRLLLFTRASARLRFDRLKLRMWCFGPILEKTILGRCCTLFALMYSAGIPVPDCLATLQSATGNDAFSEALADARTRICGGETISAAFTASALFPPLVNRMLQLGEATGRLDAALLNASYFYDRDAAEAVERLERLIEPVLTLIIGAVFAWIVLSALLPVYDSLGRAVL